jgi:hypothetical protein
MFDNVSEHHQYYRHGIPDDAALRDHRVFRDALHERAKGAGRAVIGLCFVFVYVNLALTTTPLFAVVPAAVFGFVGVVGVLLNHRFQRVDGPRYIRS